MGTHKFKLSNITPNALFYKLKQMRINNNNKSIKNSKTTTNIDQTLASNEAAAAISIPTSTSPLQVTISQSRKSYHIKSSVDPPMKLKPSKKRRPDTKSSAACSCATTAVHSVRSKSTTTTTTTSSSSIDNLSLPPEARCFDRMIALSSTSCNCSSNSLVADFDDDEDEDDAVVIAVDRLSLAPNTEDTAISKIDLPPIKTEHKKFSDLVEEIGPRKQRRSPVRRSSGSPRVRIRTNSPRLSKRVESHGGRRKSEPRRHHERETSSSESMAVVKSSADPERDFRESMVEMIVENEIRAAKDLEELLACYLSLNSVEYHHLIIQAFKQIWFDLNGIQ